MSPPASPTGSPQSSSSPPPAAAAAAAVAKPSSLSSDLSLDLTSLPPLVWPSPPSNTLLITNLNNPSTFHASSLSKIRDLLSSPTPLNSFSPLRSFHRIIVSYATIDAAVAARELLESPSAVGLASSLSSPTTTTTNSENHTQQQQQRMKIYFGSPTPILGADSEDQHLHPPAMGKLLFISPPPSPPCGWEIREEEPPNKETHAEDLQRALAGLGGGRVENDMDVDEEDEEMEGEEDYDEEPNDNEEEELDGFGKRKTEGTRARDVRTRRKSLTTMVYHPRDHGDREDLPAVMVEDTSGAAGKAGLGRDDDEEEGDGKKIMAHTARPPVELMEG